jgi:hypothetical protein
VVLVAALLEAWRRIGDDDKVVFGAAVTAYATGMLAALELLVRGKSRGPWVLVLLADAALLVIGFFLAVVVGGGAH